MYYHLLALNLDRHIILAYYSYNRPFLKINSLREFILRNGRLSVNFNMLTLILLTYLLTLI